MKRLGRWTVTFLCIAALTIAALMFVPTLFGYQRYVIVGGSMTGTIDKGSVIYSKVVPVGELQVGDIITFVPPAMTAPVTHRIIAITKGDDGRLVYRTKGDFNQAADPWNMNLSGPNQARYAFHLPYVGYLLAGLAIRQVRMIVIGLPALVIALSLLWSLWRQAGDEVKRQEEEEAKTGVRSKA